MFTHPQSGFTRDGFRFYTEYCIERQGMGLYVMRRDPANRVETTQLAKIEWEPLSEYGTYHSPTLVCDPESMQHLFNSMWERGFRPTGPVKQDAIIEAKDEHLQDLRKLLFTTLGVKE